MFLPKRRTQVKSRSSYKRTSGGQQVGPGILVKDYMVVEIKWKRRMAI